MLKICICDDNEAEVYKIEGLLRQFKNSHPELPLVAQSFRSAFDLLDCIEKQGGFNLYLLDILMPGISGMELAKRIRERMEKVELLFLTTSREYAVEAFGVEAAGYLMKPVQHSEFDRVLSSCIQRLKPEENPSLMLKTKSGLHNIPVYELMSVESIRHNYRCTMAGGATLTVPGTISSLFEQLRTYPCFYMPHRAFIVNFNYMSGLTATEILMSDGQRIPVSRNSYMDLKNTFINYTLQKSRRT